MYRSQSSVRDRADARSRAPLSRAWRCAAVGALLTGAVAAQPGGVVSSPPAGQQLCPGDRLSIAWQPPTSMAGPEVDRIQLYRANQAQQVITTSVPATSSSFPWTVPSVASGSDYRITVVLRDFGSVPPQTVPVWSGEFSIGVGCGGGGDPGGALRREIEALEPIQFREFLTSPGRPGPKPPGPVCTSCPYIVELGDLRDALAREDLGQVKVKLSDRRGKVLVDLGTLPTGKSAGRLPDTRRVETTLKLSIGRNCGFRLDISDARGRKLASSDICLQVPKS